MLITKKAIAAKSSYYKCTNRCEFVRRDSPPDSSDQRHYYCLNCKGEGNPSDFDDFTGLPIGSTRFTPMDFMLVFYRFLLSQLNSQDPGDHYARSDPNGRIGERVN